MCGSGSNRKKSSLSTTDRSPGYRIAFFSGEEGIVIVEKPKPTKPIAMQSNAYGPPRRQMRKGRTRLLWVVLLLSVSFGAHAQKITLSVKNASLQDVFKEMEKQSGYVFFYNNQWLAGAHPVTLTIRNFSLRAALDSCLADQPLEYTIVNRTVVTRQKKAPPASPSGPPAAPVTPPGDIVGVVFDSTFAPLADATIMIKGTNIGTHTNSMGRFVLRGTAIQDSGLVLTVTYTGYQTQQHPVQRGGGTLVPIIMKPSLSQLDQVEVIAYGTTTQRYNVGSVAVVRSETIERQPVMNPLEALQGQVAGLQVTVTNGAPGAMVLTQIRGQNTLPSIMSQTGVLYLSQYNQPLYIIDGIPFAPQNNDLQFLGKSLSSGPSSINGTNNPYGGISPMNSINPLDIESISVLKDADATAIYGSRGSNGVIIITTKRARPGKMGLAISINDGPTTAAKTVKMMNTSQYLAMRHEALKNDGLAPDPKRDYDLLLFDSTKNTNWYKQILNKTAQHLDAHVTVSGGTNLSTYILAGGYTYSSYNVPGDFADQRVTFHSGFSAHSADNRLTLDVGSDFSFDQNKSANGASTFGLINIPPNFPGFLDNRGSLLWSFKGIPYSSLLRTTNNPYAGLRQPSRLQNYNFNEHLHIGYKIWRGLSIGGTFGYSRFESETYSATPVASQNPANQALGSASFIKNPSATLDLEPQLNFDQTIGKARLSILLGATYTKNITSTLAATGLNYSNDALLNSLAGASTISVGDGGNVTKYVGSFGRINFIWDSRYILNLTGNINGSSLFGPGHRYGSFGSLGAGWIFSETKWIKQALPWLSFGKVSANYGVTGSNNVTPYQYQPNWQSSGTLIQYQGSAIFTPQNLFAPDFHWATTREYNGHLSLGLFHDWIVMDGGVYLNRCGDQLLNIPLPSQAGFSTVTANAPYTLQNSGWELSVTPRLGNPVGAKKGEFTWQAPRLNISANYNKILDIAPNSPYAGIFIAGKPITARPFVKYLGVDPATGLFLYREADNKTVTTDPSVSSAFRTINPGDANQLINIAPTITLGIGDGFSYKGFTVSFMGQFVKQKGYNYLYSVYGKLNTPGTPSFNEPAILAGKEWKTPGDKASIQQFSTKFYSNAFPQSTGAVGDASYFRISNLSIAYQLPAYLKKTGMKGATINLRCQNLLTISGYKVGDPTTQNIYSIPPQRVIAGGLNLNF
jgi:TonB-linked SusC/RagA family outer membrane protein